MAFEVKSGSCAAVRKRWERALEREVAQGSACESGARPVPVSMLPAQACILGVSVEELIGEPPSAAARKRGPAPTLQRHMERISALPKAQQKLVLQVLESVLQQGQAAGHR